MKKIIVTLIAVSIMAPAFVNTLAAQIDEEPGEEDVRPENPGFGPQAQMGFQPGERGMMGGLGERKMMKKPGVGPKMNIGRADLQEIEGKVIEIIKKNDPEFAKKLEQLKKDDPFKYRQVIKISFNLINFERNAEDKTIEKDIVRGISLEYDVRELALKYEKASVSDKDRIKTEIKSKLNELFDIRTKAHELKIKRLEAEVSELKSTITKRKANKDKIVEQRLNQIIGGKELNW
ncbi:MAG: hypothetical protein K6357_02515 [Elusimicrobiota bacterium]